MNIKQISLTLISIGTLIFILWFLREIITRVIFQNNILILAFSAILIGLVLLGYSIFKESKGSNS